MKVHCLIPSSFSVDQWQYLPSSLLLLSFFAAKWIAIWFLHLLNHLNGLINHRKNQVEFLLQKLMVAFLACQRFCLWHSKTQGIRSDLRALCVVQCDSPTELGCRKRSQTCSAGTQEPSDGFCCLLCPDPRHFRHWWWASLFAFLICDFLHPCFGVCIPPWGACWVWAQAPLWLALLFGKGIIMFTIPIMGNPLLPIPGNLLLSCLNWISNANSCSYCGTKKCRGYIFSSLLLRTYMLRQH